MNFKILGLFGVLALAPAAAMAAPAGGLTAQSYENLATAPQVSHAAVAPGDATAKVEKVWWRGGRGFGYRGFGYRGFGYRGFGYRRPFFGYGYGYGWRRPYWGHYYAWHRPYWRRRFFY